MTRMYHNLILKCKEIVNFDLIELLAIYLINTHKLRYIALNTKCLSFIHTYLSVIFSPYDSVLVYHALSQSQQLN